MKNGISNVALTKFKLLCGIVLAENVKNTFSKEWQLHEFVSVFECIKKRLIWALQSTVSDDTDDGEYDYLNTTWSNGVKNYESFS